VGWGPYRQRATTAVAVTEARWIDSGLAWGAAGVSVLTGGGAGVGRCTCGAAGVRWGADPKGASQPPGV